MRVVVITSCTGEKVVSHDNQLTLSDFRQGQDHIRHREQSLSDLMRPAEDLYSGQQHVRLMRGVKAFREAHPTNGAGPSLDLQILSAGYGMVHGSRELAPYEATFAGMKVKDLRSWADQIGVPQDFRKVLAQPYDLALVLLGDSYLKACAVDDTLELGGPTLFFCGARMAKKLPELSGMTVVPLSNPDAKRFSCGLVALKGELAARLLSKVNQRADLPRWASAAPENILQAVDDPAPSTVERKGPIANAKLDVVINIPSTWKERSHRQRMRYFIPDWDDQVDPDFDFLTDTHSGGTGDWSNQTYAHQMFSEPNYDGILISKVVAEHGTKKKKRINEMGVHRFLRVPRSFPVMGDCGAFGYIKEKDPPYTTNEIIDYYGRLDFDFGVSVDHLIVTATSDEAKYRYDLTINNADEFLREHRAAGHAWTPIGAVQGWDPRSYAQAARRYVAMGYDYIALGGLVRTSTKNLLPILQAVKEVVPDDVQIHLFGLARINAIADFHRFGVRSVDSASYLRQAWMRTKTSYVTTDGSYAALRIPEAGKSFRAKRMSEYPELTDEKIATMEQNALQGVRAYAGGNGTLDNALNALLEYDQYVTADRVEMGPLYRRTLENRPWERCPCEVCKAASVEVVIFRGNNRNRRRGFHNTYVFYRLFAESVMQAESVATTPLQTLLPLQALGGHAR